MADDTTTDEFKTTVSAPINNWNKTLATPTPSRLLPYPPDKCLKFSQSGNKKIIY